MSKRIQWHWLEALQMTSEIQTTKYVYSASSISVFLLTTTMFPSNIQILHCPPLMTLILLKNNLWYAGAIILHKRDVKEVELKKKMFLK